METHVFRPRIWGGWKSYIWLVGQCLINYQQLLTTTIVNDNMAIQNCIALPLPTHIFTQIFAHANSYVVRNCSLKYLQCEFLNQPAISSTEFKGMKSILKVFNLFFTSVSVKFLRGVCTNAFCFYTKFKGNLALGF